LLIDKKNEPKIMHLLIVHKKNKKKKKKEEEVGEEESWQGLKPAFCQKEPVW
jgi:hypothetical protein